MPKKWTDEEEQFLLDHADDMSRSELAEKFDVSAKSITDKLRRLAKKEDENEEEEGTKPSGGGKKKKGKTKTKGRKKSVASGTAAIHDDPESPLDRFGQPASGFIMNYIRFIEYHDLAGLLGIDAQELKDAVEEMGIKLPIERARKWEDIYVGEFRGLDVCARCQVQTDHTTFLVGIKDCRKCIEKNIEHWLETEEPINLDLREMR
jgi:hypothetical protein